MWYYMVARKELNIRDKVNIYIVIFVKNRNITINLIHIKKIYSKYDKIE